MEPLLWKKDEPIVSSLLETDVYKVLMLNYIFRYYTNLHTTFSFINRTDVDLLRYIDINELKEQLAHVARLRFTEDDIGHLKSWEMFRSSFPQNLRDLKLEMPDVKKGPDGRLVIDAGGLWSHTTLWEIFVLPIVSELYGRGRAKAEGVTEVQLFDAGNARLQEKIAFLNVYSNLHASQFGLRRRMSSLWERHVTTELLEKTNFLTGVSNVSLARDLGVEAQGTNAHELPMAAYAYARGKSNFDARASVYDVLRDWQSLYGQKALVMLPDAYGTDAFFERLPDIYLYDWRGFRQDSGDPIDFGEKVIALYQKYGIDPREKIIIWSDGLTPDKMLKIHNHFGGRIIVAFGVGTDLTNDFGVIKPLSLVMKLTEVNGRPTVKLSDNIAKATGDREEVEVAKHIFGYTNQFTEAVRV